MSNYKTKGRKIHKRCPRNRNSFKGRESSKLDNSRNRLR